jgi:hypothetical protein
VTDVPDGVVGGLPVLRVSDASEEGRYEARLEGEDALAAIVEYRLGSGWIAFLHTEVRPDLEGRGVGGRVAAGVIDAARARGLKVIPRCPFIAAWLRRHPEHHDILLHPLDSQ